LTKRKNSRFYATFVVLRFTQQQPTKTALGRTKGGFLLPVVLNEQNHYY
jgi:hypothetical protein